MKKLFLSILAMILVSSASYAANNNPSIQELLYSKKPLALLIYANWADNLDSAGNVFSEAQQTYSTKYNFKSLNIASEETKEYNKNNYIYPNLPYIILYKSQGKISRRLDSNCITNPSCLKEKLDLFAQ